MYENTPHARHTIGPKKNSCDVCPVTVCAQFVDIPALLASVPLFDRLGRAYSLVLTLLLGGAACIGCVLIPVWGGCVCDGDNAYANPISTATWRLP